MAVYDAYWDESGVNNADSWLTVAGFVSTPDRWTEFTARWLAQLERFELPTFHANRFNAGVREFNGWTLEQKTECSTALTDVILKHVVGSVGMSVPSPELRSAIPADLQKRVGHPYAIASRYCMVEAAGLLRGTLKMERDLTLNHVFGEGALGRGQLEAVLYYERENKNRRELLALGTVAFRGQLENPPLQAADFLTWELSHRMTTRRSRSAINRSRNLLSMSNTLRGCAPGRKRTSCSGGPARTRHSFLARATQFVEPLALPRILRMWP